MKTTFFINRLLIALFLAALVTPAIFLKPDEQAAAAEKRTLAPWPGLPKSRDALAKFPRAFDAFFADHFGFRRFLIINHSRISFFVLRTSPSPKIILGKNNWLYYNGKAARDGDTIADFRGYPLLSQGELERWRWMLQDQHDWLTAQGVHHVIAFIPAKEVVYPENMPDHMTRLGPFTIDQITTYLREKTTLPFINVTPALLEARQRVLAYHPNDTHWNEFGCYIGYREIMNEVAKIYPQCAPLREEDFVREEFDGAGGDLADMINLRDEIVQQYVFMRPKIPRIATKSKLGDDDLADVITSTGNTNLPRAAILRDSFTEIMIPNLSEHFDQAHFQWSRTGFEASLMQRVNPQIVIQIIADRAFRKSRRYPVMMETFAVGQRFELASNIVQRVVPGDTSVPFAPVANTTLSADSEGWVIAKSGGAPMLELPAPRDTRHVLPIIRWTLVSEDTRDVFASWTSSEMDDRGSFERRTPPFTIHPGTNLVYQSLVDPAIASPIILQLGRNSGTLRLVSMELRGIPR